MATCEVGDDASNFAYKGIAVRLDPGQGGVSRGGAWMLYEHDTLRLSAAWTGRGFIDWNGINFNGRHQVHPRVVGTGPRRQPGRSRLGESRKPGSNDPRVLGRDGRRYGPLPVPGRTTRGSTSTATGRSSPTPSARPTSSKRPVARSIRRNRTSRSSPAPWRSARRPHDLSMRVAPAKVAVSLVGEGRSTWIRRDGIDPAEHPAVRIIAGRQGADVERRCEALDAYAAASAPSTSIEPLTHGGPRRWPDVLKTRAVIGRDDGPFAADVLTVPDNNPWLCQMRPSGFDFLPDGRARRSAPGTATSGWSTGSTSRRGASPGNGSPRGCSSRWG